MPNFWRNPTGSMGVGLISRAYQSPFIRQLCDRSLVATDVWRVWRDIRRPCIDRLPRALNFGEDRRRTKAPADYESQLVAVATRQVRAENAVGLHLRVRLKDVRPNNVLRGFTNGYGQLAGSRRAAPTFAIVMLCSAEEPGLSLEER
jgi:hypothetical protein